MPGWVVARVVVAAAWFANLALVEIRFDGVRPVPTDQGLFAWDGAYYRGIAELGYAGVEPDGLRFHPLFPLTGVNGTGLLVLASVSALVAGALVHRLAAVTTGDRDLARRAATLVGLAPPAFSAVWAYAEGPFLVLAAVQLLALHRRRWWLAGVAGALASLTRPSGLLLALPAGVEALRVRAGRPGPLELAGRVAAVVGPVVGVTGYLLWVEETTGQGMLPVRVQEHLRGGFVLPPVRLLEGLGEIVTDPLGDGLHIPFAFASVYLAWVCWQRLPPSWSALAIAAVLINLGANNLNSTERYAYGTIPLLVAAAAVTGGRWWRPAVVTSTLGLLGMTALAWHGRYVP